MATCAASTFTVDRKESQPTAWEGGQMSRTQYYKSFSGDLIGTSAVEATMLGLDEGGPAIYVGIERFTGTVNGRQGTFILLHQASHHATGGLASWKIVTGSGTGELVGIQGDAEILPDHNFVLTYELASAAV